MVLMKIGGRLVPRIPDRDVVFKLVKSADSYPANVGSIPIHV
jgi:hypothetical protein